MSYVDVETIQTENYDTVISMLDYYPESVAGTPFGSWLRLWPQDGWKYMTERIKEFLGGKELPPKAMALILNMDWRRNEEAVILRNKEGMYELYLI